MRRSRFGRRTLLAGTGTGLGVLLLAACGTDTSSRYDSGGGSGGGGGDDGSNTGYVAGDGVTKEIDPDDRTDPVEFSGKTYDDKEFSSADARGHILVANVWYASCAPCRKEAPELKKIAEDYADKDVEFVGINVRDQAGPAQAFEKNYELPYPSLPDLDAKIMYDLRGQVSPNAVPSTLVLDDEGRVAARISGAADPSILRSMLDRVLGE